MPTIVISYRRADTSAIAGRILDRLAAHYGEASVFMDIDHIPFGIDFREHIHETLQRTDVVLAVIGPNWLGSGADGVARMQDKSDPVRVEIETALARKTPIIPVLVDGAKMPPSTELPPEFGNFAFLNAAEVATGRDFRTHMERLIGAIDRATAGAATPAARSTAVAAAAVAAGQASPPRPWATDAVRYFLLPLVLLLVAHHVVVNMLDLKTADLWIASAVIAFAFGAALLWLGGRGAGPALALAIALGVVAVAGMTLSQSLNSGDPIMPQSRVEWWDNVNVAALIALSFLAGHALAGAARTLLRLRAGKP
jgi:TIR domain